MKHMNFIIIFTESLAILDFEKLNIAPAPPSLPSGSVITVIRVSWHPHKNPSWSPPPSRFLHRLILIMQLRFCEALFMLRMNAAHSLVFFAATPSPPLPSANDSSRRSVESRLHTESSSHGCTTRKNDSKKRFRKTADVGCVQSPVIY